MPGTTVASSASPKHLSTSAGQVDTITFANNVSDVVIVMKTPGSGSAGLYVTSDGTTPSANADGADWVPPVAGAYVRLPLSGSADTVKVFSATVDAYMVRGV